MDIEVESKIKQLFIDVEKVTDIDLMQWACSMTIDAKSNMSLPKIYKCEHSPIRTQWFKVSMFNIFTMVSIHFVRHNKGVTHFVKSMRDDRGAVEVADRYTHINHGMLINAQALINMARKRLCYKASEETRYTMIQLKKAIRKVDPDLAKYMVPECIYRGKVCPELKPCKEMKGIL
jgi:predicted CDP-diglyceride synthetase/phosphatidate cytidylyltransferase